MKRVADERAQVMQRVRVGMIGLAAIILLIGLASMILSGVRDDRARQAAGGSNAAVVANMASIDELLLNESDEPLADLGVAPGSASVDANAQGR
jgi:cobalamin synthase